MSDHTERIAKLAEDHGNCTLACDTKLLIVLMLKAFEDGVEHGCDLTLREMRGHVEQRHDRQ